MRFLQTGDWHLGKVFYETSLVEDQRYFLDQIVTELEQAEADTVPYDAVAVPGDIYDRAVPPPEAVTLFSNFLNRVHTKFPRLHLFFLSGNHDSSDRLSFTAELLNRQNIHICTDTRHFTEPVIIWSPYISFPISHPVLCKPKSR
jgi:DNA repair protein SbcD/Mre11